MHNDVLRAEDRSQFEGSRETRTFTGLPEKPELRFYGVQTPYVPEDPSLFVLVLMFEKRVLGPLCHLSVTRGQQTAHNTVQDCYEGLQEGLHVCATHYSKFSSILTILREQVDGMNG